MNPELIISSPMKTSPPQIKADPLPSIIEGSDGKLFRLQSKNFGITYPMTDVPIDDLFGFLCGIFPLLKAPFIELVREAHVDGNKHFHGLVQLSKKPDFRNCRFLDYKGHHPSFVKVTDADGWDRYINEDKDDPIFQKRTRGVLASNGQRRLDQIKLKNEVQLKYDLVYLTDNGLVPLIQLPLVKKARDYYFSEQKKTAGSQEGKPAIGINRNLW